MKHTIRTLSALLLSLLLTVPLAACGGGASGEKKELVIYDGEYSEMQLIHYMVKLLVEDQTDLTVSLKDQMSGVNSFRELIAGNCDLMNSYDGTLLTTYLHLDPTDVPEGTTLYDFANEQAMEQHGVRLLDKIGSENTYAIAVTQAVAEKYGLETVSDLIPVAGELTFGAEHEFFSLEGSMKYDPFVAFYGLNFKDSVKVDMGLKYSAVESGSFEVTEVYATDGLNRKAQLKVLQDDLAFFPEYNDAILVRDAIFKEFADVAPNLEEVLNQLGGRFTDELMTDLTYAVDVEGRTVPEVAQEFLESQGLLTK